MIIAYVNTFDTKTITASSENANFPATNVQDERLTKVWKSNTKADTLTIDMGAGNTLNPTFAFVLGHNMTASGTYKIQSSDDNFSTTNDDITLTHDADFIGDIISASARRYWRFNFSDAANADGFLSAGRVWLGTTITLTNTFGINFEQNNIDTSVFAQSVTGQFYGNKGIRLRKYVLNFPFLSNSERQDTIQPFLDTVFKGQNFIFVFDESDLTTIKPLYCFLDQDTSFPHIPNDRYGWRMGITEAK